MVNLVKKIVIILLIAMPIVGYGQHSVGGEKIRYNEKVYAGTERIKDILIESKDTVFMRYFTGRIQVDSTATWTNKIVYKGEDAGSNKYIFHTENYRKSGKDKKLSLKEISTRTYLKKETELKQHITERYLLDGLVEEIVLGKNGYKTRCKNLLGKVLNHKGCLSYTGSEFPKNKMVSLSTRLANLVNKVSLSAEGDLPTYILISLESDVESKKWNIVFDFPKGYEENEQVYSALVDAIETGIREEELKEYHYNKDIYGNLYTYSLIIPINFK